MKRNSQSFLHVLPEFFLKSGENSLFFRLFRGLFHHFAQKLAQFRGNFAHRRMDARRKIAVRSTVVRVGHHNARRIERAAVAGKALFHPIFLLSRAAVFDSRL